MDNAASRLLDILLRAKQLPPSNPCLHNWKVLFGIDHDHEVPEHIGALLSLSGEAARQIVELHPDCTAGVDHWRSRLTAAMSMATLQSSWNDFFKHVDSHSITYLKMQAKLVNGERRTAKLDGDRLDHALSALRTSLDDIVASELAPEAKIILLERIRSLIAAIENYGIVGQEAIFDLLKATAFDISTLKDAGETMPNSNALREGLSILADLMTVASSIPAIAPPALALIERIVQ
ncbi:TPA: hypothetical protein UMF74_002257 [Stenotrophomonas maltophilia]|jgi:hypothetical protein|uniref:hypothetical protein n=1 Tax=Stenotrophomonas maltophilia TaxID=40324 RepID=UPI0013137AD7|nr:hypothetical protein [Stenotrophomonas maltophilia]EKT4088135.1 hypothetical protein [Stenotrophomonas maltophilia]HEL3171332.1 hypothetical protein [Stenotrophomonas maltophilia]HEL3195609.1 hypothetical protein [Stenotrophomonas maltophilia]